MHPLNGLADASVDGAPVVAVTGQVDTSMLGTAAHQELDQRAMFAPITVFSETVVHAEQLPTLAVLACRAALARRGVAHLALPANLAQQKVSQPRYGVVHQREPRLVPNRDDLAEAATLLREAQRPLILAGIGAAGAVSQLLETAERLAAPIIKTLRGRR